MRFLLDTHAFIWWDSEPEKLSPRALALCQNPGNEILLSVVSLWEIQIKTQLGKIRLRQPLAELVEAQQKTNGVTILPLEASHVYALGDLPRVHNDPFDRMIVAQAKVSSLLLVSSDDILRKYTVEVDW